MPSESLFTLVPEEKPKISDMERYDVARLVGSLFSLRIRLGRKQDIWLRDPGNKSCDLSYLRYLRTNWIQM